ncbi:flagellin [Roseospira goensis]|uniref:Flagellin n=1 Tax=Roseospira goensis TaxID=391922 RepID=A0A7W6RYH0_9PROT|nr:flagellin [Roseospira goensis]MBB4284892.1 flagellin-like hook-associated protein FlgL [Roseospira goensis]
MADITLSSATRSNLLSLQRTTDLIDRTQGRLSTGKKVNSAIDDALSFFKARNLSDRASDLSTIKNNITEGINVVQTAVKSLESMEDVIKQMKALASTAKSEDSSTVRKTLASQFNDLASQLNHIVNDAEYNGVNLLNTSGETFELVFSEQTTTRRLDVDSTKLLAAQLGGGIDTAANDWASAANPDTSLTNIDSALTKVREEAQRFGTNAALMEIRKDFTEEMINTLEGGASQLVNADVNAESANMLALQTRQQLGTISLSIAQQSEQSVLRLF